MTWDGVGLWLLTDDNLGEGTKLGQFMPPGGLEDDPGGPWGTPVQGAPPEDNFTVSVATSTGTIDEDGGIGSFQITAGSSVPSDLTVNYNLTEGSATEGAQADFTVAPSNSSVVIPTNGGVAIVDITVTGVNNDDVGDKTVVLTLTSVSGGGGGFEIDAGKADATITLTDDDAPAPYTVEITQGADAEGVEGGTYDAFTITSDVEVAGSDLTVFLNTSGTAQGGVDYTSVALAVIPVGQTSVNIQVETSDNQDVEDPKTVILTIGPDPSYSVGVNDEASFTINDDDGGPPDPEITIDTTPVTIQEYNNGIDTNITVTASAPVAGDLEVGYILAGSALNGPSNDYTGADSQDLPATVTIPNGGTTANIAVRPVDDVTGEGFEDISIQLQGGVGYTVGANDTAPITIADDDTPTVQISPPTASVGEGDFVDTEIAFSYLIPEAGMDYTVTYELSGTATEGVDYTFSVPSPITLNSEAQTVPIRFTATPDIPTDIDETIIATIAAGAGYTVGVSDTATLTITDVAPLPQVTIAATAGAFEEGAVPGQFTVTSNAPAGVGGLTVDYEIDGNTTAETVADYEALNPLSVVILEGQTEAIISVTPVDDDAIEGNEDLVLAVINGDGYQAGNPNVAVMTITDNDIPESIAIIWGLPDPQDNYEPAAAGTTLGAELKIRSNYPVIAAINLGDTNCPGDDYELEMTYNGPGGGSVSSGIINQPAYIFDSPKTMIPGGPEAGTYTVIATCQGGAQVESDPITATLLASCPGDFCVDAVQNGSTYEGTLNASLMKAGDPAVSISLEDIADEGDILITPTTVFTVNQSWNGAADVTYTELADPLAAVFTGYISGGTAVDITSSIQEPMRLSDEAFIIMPNADFAGYSDPIVYADGGTGIGLYKVEQCTAEEYTGGGSQQDYINVDNYNVPTDRSCYIAGDGTVLIATRHFSAFAAGEGTGQEIATLTITGNRPWDGDTSVPRGQGVEVFFDEDPDSGSTIFPLTNTGSSVMSIMNTDLGAAVTGTWETFPDPWMPGGFIAKFQPQNDQGNNVELLGETNYTFIVDQAFAGDLQHAEAGVENYEDVAFSGSYEVSFTTEASVAYGGDGFGSDQGGENPADVWLSFPDAWNGDIFTPTMSTIILKSNRLLDTTTFAGNVTLHKITNGVEGAALPATILPTVQETTTSEQIYIVPDSQLQEGFEYVAKVTRDVTDSQGMPIAGNVEGNDGEILSTIGWGFDNMGPVKEYFVVGTGSLTVESAGKNIDMYIDNGNIVGVPVNKRIKLYYTGHLDPTTVSTSTVYCSSTSVTAEVEYIPSEKAILIEAELSPNTEQTWIVEGAQDMEGNVLGDRIFTFTTGGADSTDPQIVFAEADNYGFSIWIDETMDFDSATDMDNWTFKTCPAATTFTNATTCSDASTPTTLAKQGKNLYYNETGNGSKINADGFTLTPDLPFYVIAGAGLTDLAGNSIDASANSYTGIIDDASLYEGGQGMATMAGIGNEDINWASEWQQPTNFNFSNSKTNKTSTVYVDIPFTETIAEGSLIYMTINDGTFDVSNAIPDPNTYLNEGKFASTDPEDGEAGGAENDGISVIEATNTIIMKLDRAIQSGEYFMFDIADVITSSEAVTANTTIKAKTSAGVLIESFVSNEFSIVAAGSLTVSGTVKDESDDSPISGITVYIMNNNGTYEETITDINGEYSFTGQQAGKVDIGVDPFYQSGGSEYMAPPGTETMWLEENTTKNFLLTALGGAGSATLNVRVMAEDLESISSLGFNDSIDIFVGGPSAFMVKTLTRSELQDHLSDSIANPITFNLTQIGGWNVGMGPAIPFGTFQVIDHDWVTMGGTDVMVTQSDLDSQVIQQVVTMDILTEDQTVTGTVVDQDGDAIPNAEVFAYSPSAGMDFHTQADLDGSFSMGITEGVYKFGTFLPGMPMSKEVKVTINSLGEIYVGNATEASETLTLTIGSTGSTVISGIVYDTSGNAVQYAPVWAFQEDGWGNASAMTDANGNYVLYVDTDGTWTVQADIPGFGLAGTNTVTISGGESSTGNNFNPSSSGLVTVSGSVIGAETVQGIDVSAWGPSGWSSAKTDSNGAFSMQLPSGIYDIEAYSYVYGSLGFGMSQSFESDTTYNFSVATPRTVTVNIVDSNLGPANLSEGVSVNFQKVDSPVNNHFYIPAGTSNVTGEVQEGQYYVDTFLPGIDHNNISITGLNNGVLTVDGTENITISIPELRSVSGVVADGIGNPMPGAWVSAFNPSTGQHLGVMANEGGSYSLMVPEGQSFNIIADSYGFGSPEYEIASTGDVLRDITLTLFENTATGTVSASGEGFANAFVFAEKLNVDVSQFASTETNADGSYSLPLGDGVWSVMAIGPGYAETPGQTVDTAVSTSGINFSLSDAVEIQDPKSLALNSSNGGVLTDDDMGVKVTVPGNALSSLNENMQITAAQNNAVFGTNTTAIIGSYGFDFNAFDQSNNPVTNFSDELTIQITLVLADLTAAGVTTYDQLKNVTIGYYDSTTGKYVSEPTTITAKDSSGNQVSNATMQEGTLTSALVATVDLSSLVDHFTTFAPIIPTGDTPPATPTGLSAVAGDTTVTLSWTANAEADMDYYNIWEANVTEGILTTFTHASCTSTCSTTITSLTNDTEYAFQILAVDDGANSSAGSSSVSVTPVADPSGEVVTPSPTGGGVILPSGGSGRSSSTKDDEDAIADFILETAKDLVEINEIGTIVDATTVISDDEVVKVTFEESTTVLDGEVDLTKGIPAPEVAEGVTTAAPEGATLIGEIYEIGLAEIGLVFSKPVTIRMAVPEGYDTDDDLKIYYLDEESDEWILVDDGGEFIEIDGVDYIAADTYHLTKFTIMELLEEVIEEVDPFVLKDVLTHWAREYIEPLYEAGIVKGKTSTTFVPNADVTRAEMVKLVIEAFGLRMRDYTELPYPDVYASDWHVDYMATAKIAGIIDANEDGNINPNEALTRAETLEILFRSSLINMIDPTSSSFVDVSASHWALQYIETAVSVGIVSGYTDGTFRPDDTVTRAESTKMLSKTMKLKALRDLLLRWKF